MPNLPNIFGNTRLKWLPFWERARIIFSSCSTFSDTFDLNCVFVLCVMLLWQPSSGGMLTTMLKCIFLTKIFLFA